MRFAAFVITYKRPEVAARTISSLFQQSFPPEKVLLIDNDPNQTGAFLHNWKGLPVVYVPLDLNLGPAGGAKKGLLLLAEEGYDWISWIDDDDPPIFPDVYERLLLLGNSTAKCGCVGIIGQRFNPQIGKLVRIKDHELYGAGSLEVDNIAGGMIKILNGKMIMNHPGLVPCEKLFFGFEELEYDLRIKKAGYRIVTDKQLFLKHRQFYNRLNLKSNILSKKADNRLFREYYSTRNLLYVLFTNSYYQALFIFLVRIFIKLIVSFRYGFSYGFKSATYNIRGLIDYLSGKYGKRV